MLQDDQPEDFVIATGTTHSLEEFVAAAFETYGLDWRICIESDPTLLRPSDVAFNAGNPAKARRLLNWHAIHQMSDVVRLMADAEPQTVA